MFRSFTTTGHQGWWWMRYHGRKMKYSERWGRNELAWVENESLDILLLHNGIQRSKAARRRPWTNTSICVESGRGWVLVVREYFDSSQTGKENKSDRAVSGTLQGGGLGFRGSGLQFQWHPTSLCFCAHRSDEPAPPSPLSPCRQSGAAPPR